MKLVICTYCNTQIYQYTGPTDRLELRAANFVPLTTKFKAPQSGQDITCPNCAIKFVGCSEQTGQLRMLVDWHYQGTGEVGTL